MISNSRIQCEALLSRVTAAEAAAALITPGSTVGMSGFTGSGYPKAVPLALAARIAAEHAAGRPFRINLWTGASTGPSSTARWPRPTASLSACRTIRTQ